MLTTGMGGRGSNRAVLVGDQARIEIAPVFYRSSKFQLIDSDDNVIEDFHQPYEFWGKQYEAWEVERCIREGLTESPRMSLDESITIHQTMDIIRQQIGVRYPNEDGRVDSANVTQCFRTNGSASRPDHGLPGAVRRIRGSISHTCLMENVQVRTRDPQSFATVVGPRARRRVGAGRRRRGARTIARTHRGQRQLDRRRRRRRRDAARPARIRARRRGRHQLARDRRTARLLRRDQTAPQPSVWHGG